MDSATESEEEKIFEEFVKEMERYMDSSVDPCEDFMKFACGKIDTKRRDGPSRDFEDAVKLVLQNESINYSSLVKARQFYKSCTNHGNFMELLQSSGLHQSWPAFNKKWKSEKFDLIKVVAVLNLMGLRSVIKHKTQFLSNRQILIMSAFKPTADEDIEDILRQLGICVQSDSTVVSDIRTVTEQLKGIQSQRIRRGRLLINKTVLSTSLGDLESSEFNYNKYFEIYFGKILGGNTECRLENHKYLEDFLNILLSADSKAVANYVLFQAGKDFLKDDHCRKLTMFHFAPTIISSGLLSYFTPNDERKYFAALNRFSSALKTISEKFKLDEEILADMYPLNDQEISKFRNSYFRQEKIDKEYDDLEIDSNNFYRNIVNLQKRFSTETQQLCLSQDVEMSQNIIGIQTLFHRSVRRHDKPMFYYFSTIILELWTNVIYFSKFSPKNEECNESVEECLKQQIEKYKFLELDPKNPYTFRAASVYPESLKEAFSNYQSWLNENEKLSKQEEDILKKRLNLNNQKAFYVCALQNLCGTNELKKNQILLGLLNSYEFANEFQCKIGASMNPRIKCLK